MFELKDYISAISGIATHYKVDPVDAMEFFVTNLITMKEFYKGAPELNYHNLGQQWNRLLSDQKLQQKATVAEMLKRGTKRQRSLEV